MKYIISGTDRNDSNTLKVSHIIKGYFEKLNEKVEIIDLRDLKNDLLSGPHYGAKELPPTLKVTLEKVLQSEGLIVVAPEYNGSMPGILKYFIDHLKFPESFEYRPVAFVGLGGLFGGLRPVEHLQQVFGYRNAFIYPQRVFLMNVFKVMKDGQLQDALMNQLLEDQARGFTKFCAALKESGLAANQVLATKAAKGS